MDNELFTKVKALKIIKYLPYLHDNTITGLDRLPNTNQIITSSTDKTILVRNYENNEVVKRLYGHEHSIFCLCILSDGRLATGSKDCTIRIWNLQNDDYPCEKILYGHTGTIVRIKELQKGIILSCGLEDKCIRIWKINRQNPLLMAIKLKDRCGGIVIHKSHCLLHVEGSLIKLFNWKNKTTIKTFRGHSNFISRLAIIQDNFFISTSWDCNCRLWIILTGECIRQFYGNNLVCSFLQISNDIFAIGYFNGEVKFWDINQEECLNTIQTDMDPVFCLLRFNEQTIVTAGQSETLTILEIQYTFYFRKLLKVASSQGKHQVY